MINPRHPTFLTPIESRNFINKVYIHLATQNLYWVDGWIRVKINDVWQSYVQYHPLDAPMNMYARSYQAFTEKFKEFSLVPLVKDCIQDSELPKDWIGKERRK